MIRLRLVSSRALLVQAFAASGRGSVPDEAFRSGLRERGYIEGKNIVIEFRNAAGKYDDLSGLATELVELKVDIIFAPAEGALRDQEAGGGVVRFADIRGDLR